MPDLLFELGSEELPARFVRPALADLERLFREQCEAMRIPVGAVRSFGTPRRLALLVEGLAETSEDARKEMLGPPVRAAVDEQGGWKVPALKFAESVKLPVDQLRRVPTPKGEYLMAEVEEKGRPVRDLLPAMLTACVKKLPFPKSMRWGDVEPSFGRPLQWILALFGSEVVPVVFADVRSDRWTRGHRFLAPRPIAIAAPADYEAALEAASVVPSLEKRRAMLAAKLTASAQAADGTLLEDDALLEQVLNLVEYPNPVVGAFEERHLDLPGEVLIQEMKVHQRYFALVDGSGNLRPRFIAVSNTPVRDEALSVKGYERVLRARLTDARFFFDEDRKTPLQDRLPKLARRNWVQGLGSMEEKTVRIAALAKFVAGLAGKQAALDVIEEAAPLCKCDLETGMVSEFPELQGVMGREYARLQGKPEAVALAIYEHYLPRSAADALPTGDAGALIGLADRLDSLCGLFAIGKKPTGTKDEYALRRAAIAVINLVLGRGYRFSLAAAVAEALRLLGPWIAAGKKVDADTVKGQVLEFIQDRLRPLWSESERASIVEAVLAAGADDLVAVKQRVEALSGYVERPDFGALAATFKRVANIVAKQARDVPRGAVDPARLQDAAERDLFREVEQARAAVRASVETDDYAGALAHVVTLAPFVDRFFDGVMVMAEDQAVRNNRVRLLMEITGLFGVVADFSKL